VGTVQQTAQGGFALLVLQRGGDAQEVTLAWAANTVATAPVLRVKPGCARRCR